MATKLYVANLPPDYSEQDLHHLFSSCGQVTELDIIKNYAFVHMGTNEAAQNAMAKYNNSSVNGRIIQVQLSRIQNVNRANKFTVKYDRPDRLGRGGHGNQFQRGGGHGRGMSSMEILGASNERFGPDFRGRGGFRGGRGGPDTFHRGKPYDRYPSAGRNHSQNIGISSNLKPIQPIGGNFSSMSHSSNSNLKVVQPSQQNIVIPQDNQPARLQVPIQIQHTGGALQPIPAHASNSLMHPHMQNVQAHQVMHGQQQMMQQSMAYQPITPYRELQSQGQTVTVTPQQITVPGVIHQQPLQVAQPGQTLSNVTPLVQSTGMTSGINHQQSGNPLQGYTVYERYVDYRNPQTGDIQQLAVQGQMPANNGIQAAVGSVYQGEASMGSKDPYANSQIMYER